MPEFAAKSLYHNQIYLILIQIHEVYGLQKYVQVYNVILDISIVISLTKKGISKVYQTLLLNQNTEAF